MGESNALQNDSIHLWVNLFQRYSVKKTKQTCKFEKAV